MASPLRLLTPRDLSALGLSARRVGTHLRSGELIRVRPGVYATGKAWRGAKPEQRVVARARALHRISATPPVFSHETAAAIHGLGLYRADAARVHVTVPAERPGAASGAIRHRGVLADSSSTTLNIQPSLVMPTGALERVYDIVAESIAAALEA